MEKFDTDRLNNLSIKEVVDRLGLLLCKNKCLCFIHEEKTPSFHIFPKKNIWKCFGCGAGGNVIRLVEEFNGYDFKEACKWLSNEFGIASYNVKQPIKREIISKNKSVADCKADSEIYNWFFENLTVTDSAKRFIKNRKYPDEVVEQYNLKGLDDCISFFEKCKAKWTVERLLKCGLAKENVNEETGEITYKFTWWTNTLFFPFYDNDGNIIYIQGRTLNPQYEKKYKYVNLNEVETVPFNLPILKTPLKENVLVITEGVTDCISCCLMGRPAVGIIGASGFKRKYVKQLKDFNIYVIPDKDKSQAGEKFANKIISDFATIGKTVRVVHLPEDCKDISEYYMNK